MIKGFASYGCLSVLYCTANRSRVLHTFCPTSPTHRDPDQDTVVVKKVNKLCIQLCLKELQFKSKYKCTAHKQLITKT